MPGPVIPNPTPDWLKPENASVTDTALTKAMRMIGHLIGADNPTSQILGLMMTDVPGGSATGGLAKAVEGLKARVIKAYHGSPHDFERFSLEKIGTGEGAQAYGHGLYFAENPNVAADYRRTLAPLPLRDPFEKLPENVRSAALKISGGEYPGPFLDKARTALRMTGDWRTAFESIPPDSAKVIDEYFAKTPIPGKTYEVAIHADPEDFLDWDKPLSQQSEKVKAKLRELDPERMDIIRNKSFDITAGKFVDDLAEKEAGNAGMMPQWARTQNARPQASAKLKEAGIPGIKYLDQGSRAAGEGSRNYVVFDDRLIDILKKYGLLLPAAGGAGQATISRRSE